MCCCFIVKETGFVHISNYFSFVIMDAKILSDINKKLSSIQLDLTNLDKKVTGFEKKLDEKVEKIGNRVTDNERKIDEINTKRADDIETYRKSYEAVIEGLPSKFKRSLLEIFGMICTTIGFDEEGGVNFCNDKKSFAVRAYYPNVKIYLINGKKSNTSTMIVRFSSIFDKDVFINQYFSNSSKLTLKSIGFKSDTRIFIHQNLTSKKYKIFREALKYKKAKQIKSVRVTSYGDIGVKLLNSEKFDEIVSVEILKQLCGDLVVPANDKETEESSSSSEN